MTNEIPILFQFDWDNYPLVLNEVNPECQWVLDGDAIPWFILSKENAIPERIEPFTFETVKQMLMVEGVSAIKFYHKIDDRECVIGRSHFGLKRD
jgi:hypothetical protein